MLVIAEIGLFI